MVGQPAKVGSAAQHAVVGPVEHGLDEPHPVIFGYLMHSAALGSVLQVLTTNPLSAIHSFESDLGIALHAVVVPYLQYTVLSTTPPPLLGPV